MRRGPLLALALALAASAASCGEADETICPGEVVASFAFSGEKVPAGDPGLGGLDPVPAVPDCPDAVGYVDDPENADLRFQATLAGDPTTQAAALCRPNGVVLYGQRSGSRYAVETATEGAVLDGCSATCSAALRLHVVGDVLGAGTSEVSFAGILVEVLTFVAGDCGTCLTEAAPSCAGRYTLTGSP